MGSNQMVLACAFNAMRAEVTKFEATLVALGDRDLEAWEVETIRGATRAWSSDGSLDDASPTTRRDDPNAAPKGSRGHEPSGSGIRAFAAVFFAAAHITTAAFRSAVSVTRNRS